MKRLAAGFTKTVALVLPTQASANPYQPASGGARFAQLEAFLGGELNEVIELLQATERTQQLEEQR